MATTADASSMVMVVKEVADIPKEMCQRAILSEKCIRTHVVFKLWNEEVLERPGTQFV
jgi:hypothetical protein